MTDRNPQLGEISPLRAHPEPTKDEVRTPFMRDRDRIIHCAAFRRLEYKTQVFINYEGDHYRTRLTHSLEVAQIARSMVLAVGGDEALAESLALAHDLGHPPFGHAGENALRACYRQFDHNLQTFKIVTALEDRYPHHRGLNLTHACLDGLLKHNYPNHCGYDSVAGLEFDAAAPPSVEAEMAAIADDIAYNCHDLDDGLRDFDENRHFFTLEEVAEAVPTVGEIRQRLRKQYPQYDNPIPLLISTLIGTLIGDIRRQTAKRIQTDSRLRFLSGLKPRKNAHMEAFSPRLRQQMELLRKFLDERLYKNRRLAKIAEFGGELVTDLFNLYKNKESDEDACNYIAGMTDRFAVLEHQKHFKEKHSLREALITKV